MWVDDGEARRYIKAGQARFICRRGKVCVLQAVAGEIRKPGEARLVGRGTALDHTRYSHRRETQTNPPRVWAYSHLTRSVEKFFHRVVSDCII